MAQEAVAQEAATRLARKPKTPVVDRPVSLFRFADEVNYSPKQTTFKLFAPKDAESVTLSIYAEGQGGKPLQEMMMSYSSAGYYTATLDGDWKGKFYTFDMGRGECPGVFAKAVGVNGQRGAIVDLDETNPEGWDTDRITEKVKMTDLVIYEMHHRDFSIDPSSGLKYKGKFLALTEQKAIDHLKRLGVNAVHILPSYDYASVDETKLDTPQYNWGYDPLNYNVPEGSYSTDPYNPTTRIREFKQMVRALHKAGIRVILDVVYNHTFNIEGSNFQRTYPDVFYRKTADGKWSDGSGCGNETASDREPMRQFMLQSMRYWVDEYHIDGFRVDLMGVHDIETMNQIRAMFNRDFPATFIYGEGWSAGTCAYPLDKLAVKANIGQMPGIAAFGDEMRDALRGPFSDDTKGAFLAGLPGNEESLKFGIAGAISHSQVDMTKVNYSKEAWALQPWQAISYVSCHDDMCLVDRLRASILGIGQDELIRLDLLAQTAVFTSQGVPFILSGEEMLRDKKGVHNSFNSPDSINRLEWTNLEKYPQVFSYYSNLILMRKNHPAFRLGDAECVRKHLEFLPVQDCLVAFRLKGNPKGDSWKNIIVILNSAKQARSVDIPQGNYTVVCRDGVINEAGLGTVSGSQVSVPAQSAVILHE
ncbi:MAG TPA: type I pullulanase [Candidatus Prevotella stercoripullorum]|nr:type I pullulanase [Candidatus Prevotella stercoripullorum]